MTMMKLHYVVLLGALCNVPSHAVVRGLKQEDAYDSVSRRRSHQLSRRAQESFFGPEQTTNHIGTPVAIPVGGPLFTEEHSTGPPISWTVMKAQAPPPPDEHGEYPNPAPLPITPRPHPQTEMTSTFTHQPSSGDMGGASTEIGKGIAKDGDGSSYSGSRSSSFSGSTSASKSKSNKGAVSKTFKGKGGPKGAVNGFETKKPSSQQPKKKDESTGSSTKKLNTKMGKISKGKGQWSGSGSASVIGKGTTQPPIRPPASSKPSVAGPPAPSRQPVVGPPAPSRKPIVSSKPPTRAPVSGVCTSQQVNYLLNRVPEAIARNPNRCCNYRGPIFAVVTHAEPDADSESGFESFWDTFYRDIEMFASNRGLCFFMTGVDPSVATGRSLSEIMINVNQIVSAISSVPAIMTTDPTDNPDLITTVRSIVENPGLPSIGVFNSGYDNVVLESLLSGKDRLPFIGPTSDELYGQLAAMAALRILNNAPPVALCFGNGSNETATRCQEFYTDLNASPPRNISSDGLICDVETTNAEILSLVTANDANIVWAHQDCCEAAARAATRTGNSGRTVVVGCMDVVPETYDVDFITTQPIRLQAHATSSWASFPVIQELKGRDGREPEYFPSLRSLIRTAVHAVIAA